MKQVSQLVQIKQGWSICFIAVFLIFSFVVSSVHAQAQAQPQANTTTQQSASVQQQLDLINKKLDYIFYVHSFSLFISHQLTDVAN